MSGGKMSTRYSMLMVIAFGILAMGMGSMGGGSPAAIPEPEIDYKVTLVDQADVSFKLTRFSFEGDTHIAGRLGKAAVTIDFKRIARMVFIAREREISVKATMKGGQEIEINVDAAKSFYGRASYGNIRIEARDIKVVTLE